MEDLEKLKNLVLAPYILKATTLIGVGRRCGGNQFRHQFATLGILLDYKYFNDGVILKASLLHDILEDWNDFQIDDLRNIDEESDEVINLVKEVTKRKDETKDAYLERVLREGSTRAKILKCADRISNITDLHPDNTPIEKIRIILEQTEKYVIPMALSIPNIDFVKELTDLVIMRRDYLEKCII